MTFTVSSLSQEEYEAKLLPFIIEVEGDIDFVYIDTRGIPTIGIGWNLASAGHVKSFLNEVLGVDENSVYKNGQNFSSLLADLTAITSIIYSPGLVYPPKPATSVISQLNSKLNNALVSSPAHGFDFTGGNIDTKQFFFNHDDEYEDFISTSVLPYSDERVAVMSYVYNYGKGHSQSKTLANILSDISDPLCRVKAWTWMAYYSGADENLPRRQNEATLFKLFDANPTDEAVIKTFDFLYRADFHGINVYEKIQESRGQSHLIFN